ncbi:uncharacterized protein LOC133799739 [Humulus lupulus]|uniref:uncharacterized protein LOC133799739 n=1 Tax=Humulus lupulus TaxID=3486 RepID=UPI002B4109FA|nr:uncharacterized protein LOC133799739 [Humulus lupulus]
MAMEMMNNLNITNNENNNDDDDNSNNNPNRRVSRGRQKVAMMKMANESNLQVTFSKRRAGLFKKASELCTLCGVELAIIVFSPGKKVFSFGHSSVQYIIDRYLNPQNYRITPPQVNSGTLQLIEAHRSANVRELNQQLTHVVDQLDVERKRSNELNKARKARVSLHWWEAPVETLNDLAHLEHLKSAMEMLRRDTSQTADQILIQTTTNTDSLLPPNFNNMNINAPSFYGVMTTVGGAGGNGSGGGLPQLPSSASSFPNQGGLQPNSNYHYYNNNNENNYNDNDVGFDGGVANSSSSSAAASTGSTSTDTPHLQSITSGGGNANHVNMPHMPQMQAMNSGGIVNNNHVNLQSQMQALASGGSVNHVNLPPYMQVSASNGTLNHVNHVNLQPHMSFSSVPNMQSSAPANTNYINMSAMPQMMQPPNTSPVPSSVNNHFNMSPMPHHMQQPNTSPAPGSVNNHFNMSPMPHHMQQPNTTSASGIVNHINMSPMQLANNNTSAGVTVNHVNHQRPTMQLPMLPQSLPPSSQLLLQQPNSQGTHHVSNNVGYGHGFF